MCICIKQKHNLYLTEKIKSKLEQQQQLLQQKYKYIYTIYNIYISNGKYICMSMPSEIKFYLIKYSPKQTKKHKIIYKNK